MVVCSGEEEMAGVGLLRSTIDTLTYADLAQLLDDAAVESVLLEFKSAVPGRDEFLKKISSFANTFGGHLIIGALAPGKSGRLSALNGVDVEAGLRQRFIQWSYEHLEPPVDIEVSGPITVPGSPRACYVVRVPESGQAPHFIRGGRGVWIRTDEFSQRFEPTLAGRRELERMWARREKVVTLRADILARARRRFGDYEKYFGESVHRGPSAPAACFDLALVPAYPARPVADVLDLVQALGDEALDWRQIRFPRVRDGVVTQHESALILQPCLPLSLLEVNRWGLSYYAREIEGDAAPGMRGIHVNNFVGHLLAFLEHSRRMALRLGLGGTLHVEVRAWRVRNVPWVFFPGGDAQAGPRSPLDDDLQFVLESGYGDLIEDRDGLAAAILTYLFVALNWPAAAGDAVVRSAIELGYEFNYWPRKPQA